jgi:hypothetical protein
MWPNAKEDREIEEPKGNYERGAVCEWVSVRAHARARVRVRGTLNQAAFVAGLHRSRTTRPTKVYPKLFCSKCRHSRARARRAALFIASFFTSSAPFFSLSFSFFLFFPLFSFPFIYFFLLLPSRPLLLLSLSHRSSPSFFSSKAAAHDSLSLRRSLPSLLGRNITPELAAASRATRREAVADLNGVGAVLGGLWEGWGTGGERHA